MFAFLDKIYIRRAHYEVEWVYTKVRGQGTPSTFCDFFTQFVQAYLIVSMDVWGLIDRYSGIDDEYES